MKTLSDKRRTMHSINLTAYQYQEEDVKEFIKQLKKEFKSGDCQKFYDTGEHIDYVEFEDWIDKLAGDKLTNDIKKWENLKSKMDKENKISYYKLKQQTKEKKEIEK